MTLKSLFISGLVAAGLGLGLAAAPTPAEAKTRVHIGIGVGDPYWGGYGYPYRARCYNPGFIDWCGAGFYRPDPFFDPYYRPYYPRYRHVTRNRCDDAARAIRNAGYRNVRATDCSGRYYGFRAYKRGRTHALRVDTRSGRISVRN